MFRKIVMASTAAMGLAVPMGMTSEAKAADFRVQFGSPRSGLYGGYDSRGYGYGGYVQPRQAYRPYHEDRHYHVEYRDCSWGRWSRYGTYDSHARAHEVEHRLERRGYEARIVHH